MEHKMTSKPWFEDESFWSIAGPTMFTPARIAEAKAQIDDVLALTGTRSDARVLDLCCGPGRHSLELARRGFKVTGVDRNVKYLGTARKLARNEKLDVEFVERDMRRFVRRDAFDLAISMFTSFGYFEKADDDRRVAANIYRSLVPGGKLLIDAHGKETIARIFEPSGWQEVEGYLVLEERRILPGWEKIEERWIIIKGNRRNEFRFTLRLYSGSELAALLRSVGFRDVKVYGDFSGSPYDNTARRLITIARK